MLNGKVDEARVKEQEEEGIRIGRKESRQHEQFDHDESTHFLPPRLQSSPKNQQWRTGLARESKKRQKRERGGCYSKKKRMFIKVQVQGICMIMS